MAKGQLLIAIIGVSLASCADVESDLVEFQEDNRLNSANDSIYSFMGIVGKMQMIADRTVLLGEIRGDLTSVTSTASSDLKALADFTAGTENKYNNARDYYAIIQNCNYFLNNVDLSLKKRGDSIFVREFAAIKTFRAWTYLQLALNYGSVPFVTEPILEEKDADPDLYEKYDIADICRYFITDLAPYVDTKFPDYGNIGGFSSRNFCIPVRVLLGDLCLWAGEYKQAAKYYHDYLSNHNSPHPVQNYGITWRDTEFQGTIDSYSSQALSNSSEVLTYIPLSSSEYEGITTELDDVFTSTTDNNYFNQVTYSNAYASLSKGQLYTYIYNDPNTLRADTIHPSDSVVYTDEILRGDLRLSSVYQISFSGSSDATQNVYRQKMSKLLSDRIAIYRKTPVYLRYAEALNRAGYPQCAFAILKYGLCDDNVHYYQSDEYLRAGDLVKFDSRDFSRTNTIGIHARGCGQCEADTLYAIPALATQADSIEYVENAICDEMALETATEGYRFYDLMRIARHKGSPSFLAAKVANRDGFTDQALYQLLSDEKNWYLPLE